MKLSTIMSKTKPAIFIILFIICALNTKAQDKAAIKDSVIKAQMIDPFEKYAADQQQIPEWQKLSTQISSKYGRVIANRLVDREQIFYNYGRNWPAFTAALVRYTEKYEDHNNLSLLNKNAAMIAQFSTDKKELETALSWSKHTLDKEPGNADYQKTYDALNAKIANAN